MSDENSNVQMNITEVKGVNKSEVVVIVIVMVILAGIMFSYNTKGSNFGTNLIVLGMGSYIVYDLYCRNSVQKVQTVIVKENVSE